MDFNFNNQFGFPWPAANPYNIPTQFNGQQQTSNAFNGNPQSTGNITPFNNPALYGGPRFPPGWSGSQFGPNWNYGYTNAPNFNQMQPPQVSQNNPATSTQNISIGSDTSNVKTISGEADSVQIDGKATVKNETDPDLTDKIALKVSSMLADSQILQSAISKSLKSNGQSKSMSAGSHAQENSEYTSESETDTDVAIPAFQNLDTDIGITNSSIEMDQSFLYPNKQANIP